MEEHFRLTGSPTAARILTEWERQVDRFWVLRASRPLSIVEATSESARVDA